MKTEIPSPSSHEPCKNEKDADSRVAPPSLHGMSSSENHVSIDHGESQDIAADLFKEMLQYSEGELESRAKAVRWKLDLIIVPLVAVTHGLQFLNKTSLNFASAYDLREDLGLSGHRFAWERGTKRPSMQSAAIFNFGFLFWSLPTNLIIQRVPIGRYTGLHILLWSLLICLHAVARNYAGMLALRFFLGMAEAGIAPSCMNIISMWFTRSETPLRMCISLAFNGLAYIVASLVSYGIGHVTEAAVTSWQLIFLTYGGLNFVWGVVFLLLVPDQPSNARFLSHEEKLVAVWRTSKNLVGIKNPHFNRKQAVEAFCDVKVWLTTILGLAPGIILGGVTNFMTSLIKGFGFSSIQSTLLQLPLGAIGFVCITLCGLTATYIPNTRCLMLITASLPPFAGLLGIRFIGLDHRWALLGCSWLQLLALAINVLTWTVMTANFGGHTKRSVANGMWFLFFGAGNIAGSNIFFDNEAPRYYSAITALLICYAGIIVAAAGLWACMYFGNKRRTSTQDERDDTGTAIWEGMLDRTDRESRGFRYCY
ncbi:MFS general substrate transporter [Hortaea werneckii]|nr:MFS general substrate transporter [Hortaea werneckii]